MYIYGHPTTPIGGDITDEIPFRLYPCMNFTCRGRIVKLMFVAPTQTSTTMTENIQLPMFALWTKCDTQRHHCSRHNNVIDNWVEVKNLSSHMMLSQEHHRNTLSNMYEITFMGDNSFENGYFLAVYHSAPDLSWQNTVNVLYQHGGGLCDSFFTMNGHGYVHHRSIRPYIAIETELMPGEPLILCLHRCTIMLTFYR